MESTNHPVILFDGVCNLCNTFVDFVIRRDPEGVYRFASLQSALGQEKTRNCQLMNTGADSVILVEHDQCYVRSTAVLRIIRKLRFPWPLGYMFIVVPEELRDWIYDMVAKNRYRWFGKRDTCRLPTAQEQARFLD